MLSTAEDDVVDAGPKSARAGAERLCFVTRTVKPVEEMIRFVVGPDGSVVPDLKRKLPGRGLWVTATKAAVGAAVERNAFGRGFKREVRVSPDFVALVDRLLERAALDALGVAHKAGCVTLGFSKVEAALAAGPVIALIHAADASDDGVRKLTAAVGRRFLDADRRPAQVVLFTSMQLDLALGRANVVHAAVLVGPASAGFLARCCGLERFRSDDRSVRTPAARDRKSLEGNQNS